MSSAGLTETPLRAQVGSDAPGIVLRRRPSPVLPHPPDDSEKYGYIERDLPYLATLLFIGAGCLCLSQIRFELHAPAGWVFMIFTGTYTIYQAISLPVNFTGRGFDLTAHQALVGSWSPEKYPTVDIYLPICGEPLDVLENTWIAVSALIDHYPGAAQAHVLDDGPSDAAQEMAELLGFITNDPESFDDLVHRCLRAVPLHAN